MISPLFYYQLAFCVLVWLFVLLHIPGTQPGPPTPPAPAKPKRKRSTASKAFVGLTHKPPCALCDQATAETAPPSPVRPDPMPPTNHRPRTVDTSMPFCPPLGCDDRGWLGLNNLRANAHPRGGPWRQLHCRGCNGFFLEHHGTLLHGKPGAVELLVRVLACLAEGLGMRATARVLEVDATMVWHWLGAAAEPLRTFSASFLGDLHLEQLQRDAVYAVLRDHQAGERSEDEAMKRLERSSSWVWTAMEPQSKWLLVSGEAPEHGDCPPPPAHSPPPAAAAPA